MLIAAYLVEAGLVLVVAPWIELWQTNYFAHAWPWVGHLMESDYVRGAVTGIGLITFAAGARDVIAAIGTRRETAAVPVDRNSPQP